MGNMGRRDRVIRIRQQVQTAKGIVVGCITSQTANKHILRLEELSTNYINNWVAICAIFPAI